MTEPLSSTSDTYRTYACGIHGGRWEGTAVPPCPACSRHRGEALDRSSGEDARWRLEQALDWIKEGQYERASAYAYEAGEVLAAMVTRKRQEAE